MNYWDSITTKFHHRLPLHLHNRPHNTGISNTRTSATCWHCPCLPPSALIHPFIISLSLPPVLSSLCVCNKNTLWSKIRCVSQHLHLWWSSWRWLVNCWWWWGRGLFKWGPGRHFWNVLLENYLKSNALRLGQSLTWPGLSHAEWECSQGQERGGRLRRRGGGGGTGALPTALQVAVAEQMCSGHCCTGAATVEGRWDSEVDRRWDRDRMYSSATQVDRDGTGIGHTAVQLTRLEFPSSFSCLPTIWNH